MARKAKPPRPPGKPIKPPPVDPATTPPVVGSTMLCIDDSNFDLTRAELIYPVLNQNYIIRDIISNPDDPASQCFRFEEIVNPVRAYQTGPSGECAFKASRFQKVK